MAGVYLHIPFCHQACVYCDFHFSTLERDRKSMPAALLKELALRRDYLNQSKLDTIYFGGGTPSVLDPMTLQGIIDGLKEYYHWDDSTEITIEANPDDLNEEFFKALKDTEVNRLSIGIQSFKDEDLRLMNRAHSAEESRACLKLAAKYGFNNLSIDLIYGLPNQSEADWLQQLSILKDFELGHFSAYALTVEEKTVLDHWVKSGKVKLEEEAAARHFKLLQEFAAKEAYEHYELSNFAKANCRAVHNHSYWEGKSYLGLGPSAHSYNGKARHWNISNNALYLKAIEAGDLHLEQEDLSLVDRYNEWLMVSLRLEEGLKLADLERFDKDLQDHFWKEFQRQESLANLKQNSGRIYIPADKRFYSDGIASDLFYIKD